MEFTYIVQIVILVFIVSGSHAALPIEPNCGGNGGDCTTPSLCQEGWTYTNVGRCYKTVSSSASYNEALAMCQLEKGYLPVVSSSDENNYLTSAEGGATKWIGYDDLMTEGTFQWRDERKLSSSYTSWRSSEPNGGTQENCAELSSSGTWNDIPCTASRYVICEMDLTPRQLYPWSNSVYLFNTIAQDWHQAKSSCAIIEYMAVIGNENENTLVLDLHSSIVSSSSLYIGYNDVNSEGNFKWASGKETSTYTNWASGEPNNASPGEDATVVSVSEPHYYKWVDIPTSNNQPSVCETGIEWEFFNGKLYFATDYRRNAADSIAVCNSIDAELVVINSNEKNTFLVNMITKTHYSGKDFYIGYTSNNEMIWSWTDSSESIYTNWDENQGQMASACAVLSLQTGQWRNTQCDSSAGFICESEIHWIPWRNKKYYFNTAHSVYDTARENCQKLGGYLLSLDNTEEERVLDNVFRRTRGPTSFVLSHVKIYVGAKREDGVWKWDNPNVASSVTDTINWCSGFPTNDDKNCVFYHTELECYKHGECTQPRISICEADLLPTDGSLWEQRRYFVSVKSKTYSAASDECNSMGMELATITSRHEMDLAVSALQLSGYDIFSMYIGYDDIDVEGTYVWKKKNARANIKAIEFWHESSTFSDTNDCTVLRASMNDWNSVSCSTSYYHLCETIDQEEYFFIADGVNEVKNSSACLHGHTIEEVKVRSMVECLSKCIEEISCLSFNYISFQNIGGGSNCQLNDSLKSEYPEDVFEMYTCHYYEFK